MTLEEALQKGQAVQSTVMASALPVWAEVRNAFLELLEAELAATLEAGPASDDAYIARPYSNAWNGIGTAMIHKRLFQWAQALFEESLRREREVEAQQSVRLHKGYSYHNLGLVQVAQGNWDDGLQNIRRAVQEDMQSGLTMENSHAHKVTRSLIIAPERDALAAAMSANAHTPSKAVVDAVFEAMSLEMSLNAAFSIRASRTAGADTEFGLTLRLNALRDICHLYESWLHSHAHAGTLKPALDSAYGGCGQAWWSTVCSEWQMATAHSTTDAETHLQEIHQVAPGASSDHFLARSHLVTGLMRNWTHHQFDPGAPLLGDSQYPDLYLAPWACLYHAHTQGV